MTESSDLTAAIYRRDTEKINAMLQAGMRPSFFQAAALGDDGAVEDYLRNDASLVHAYSDDGFTALQLAAFFGRPRVVALLLLHGADANARSRNAMNLCAVHSAAASGDVMTLQTLLTADVDVNAQQAKGFTALHEAASNGNADMIRALLAKGADPAIKADDGRTAIAAPTVF